MCLEVSKKTCRAYSPIRRGSGFHGMKVSIQKVIWIIHEWSTHTPLTVAAKRTGVSVQAIAQLYQYLRDVCSWKLMPLILNFFYFSKHFYSTAWNDSVIQNIYDLTGNGIIYCSDINKYRYIINNFHVCSYKYERSDNVVQHYDILFPLV